MYTRRNSIESSGQHWLVLLAALLTTWMAWGPLGLEVQTLGAASALGLLLLNAVAVTLLATSRQSAAGSKQAAAAATELNALAGDLRASIAQFCTIETHR